MMAARCPCNKPRGAFREWRLREGCGPVKGRFRVGGLIFLVLSLLVAKVGRALILNMGTLHHSRAAMAGGGLEQGSA